MQSITDRISYVGVDDDNIDLFEGQYPVPSGISYNSYLIKDSSIAIVDSVDARRSSEWLAKIEMALDGRQPSFLIVQHVEPDHSGSIQKFLELYPDVKIVASAKALSMLSNFFEDVDFSKRSHVVKDGDTLCIGESTLLFLSAPMVHWPEVMFTLDITDKVLFSADAFGSFATFNSVEAWDNEARRYYCNIVGKYGVQVQAVMKKLLNLKFDIIAPLHGPLLTDNLGHYWNLYDKWSRYEPETKGTLVAYASIYGGTAEAARRLAAMIDNKPDSGETALIDLCRHDVSYAVAEAFRLSRMALCSVTYDSTLYPAMYNFLHHLEMKNLQGRKVGLVQNGSWGPAAARVMTDMLGHMKNMEVVEPVVTLKGRMHHSDKEELARLADSLLE